MRRPVFLAALIVSAALYAYSLVGVAATGEELRSAVQAQSAERLVPVEHPVDVSYRTWEYGDCPADSEPPVRVRL